MNQLTPHLWIGDAYDAHNLPDTPITAVMNLTPVEDVAYATRKYHQLGVEDGQPIPPEKITEFLGVMEQWTRDGDVILIHCAAGISRASSFTILWFMHYSRKEWFDFDERLDSIWSVYEAVVRAKRSIIQPNPILKDSILAYLRQQAENNRAAS